VGHYVGKNNKGEIMNKVILVGRLGADPELKSTNSGSVCTLRIATSENWTDKSGQKQEKTEWHRVKVWGKQGENCEKYLAKGRKVLVEGRIEYRKHEDKWFTEVKAQSVQFLDNIAPKQNTPNPQTDNTDDIPF
jgi:single-strand DNA-binding protein